MSCTQSNNVLTFCSQGYNLLFLLCRCIQSVPELINGRSFSRPAPNKQFAIFLKEGNMTISYHVQPVTAWLHRFLAAQLRR